MNLFFSRYKKVSPAILFAGGIFLFQASPVLAVFNASQLFSENDRRAWAGYAIPKIVNACLPILDRIYSERKESDIAAVTPLSDCIKTVYQDTTVQKIYTQNNILYLLVSNSKSICEGVPSGILGAETYVCKAKVMDAIGTTEFWRKNHGYSAYFCGHVALYSAWDESKPFDLPPCGIK